MYACNILTHDSSIKIVLLSVANSSLWKTHYYLNMQTLLIFSSVKTLRPIH